MTPVAEFSNPLRAQCLQRKDGKQPYAVHMSPLAVALSLLLVACIAALLWRFRGNISRPVLDWKPASTPRLSAERFETTMGELKDLREALRSVEHASTPVTGKRTRET
jgi:hypothetical protein